MKHLDPAHVALTVQALESLGFGSIARDIADHEMWLADAKENELIVNAVSDVWSVDFRRFVLKDFHVGLHEIHFTTDSAAALRREVMRIRDNFQANRYYKEAVVMSHVLAWLSAVQQHMTLDNGET